MDSPSLHGNSENSDDSDSEDWDGLTEDLRARMGGAGKPKPKRGGKVKKSKALGATSYHQKLPGEQQFVGRTLNELRGDAQRLVSKEGAGKQYGVSMDPEDSLTQGMLDKLIHGGVGTDAWEKWKAAQKALDAEMISKMKAEQAAAQKLVPLGLTLNDVKKIMETIGKKESVSPWMKNELGLGVGESWSWNLGGPVPADQLNVVDTAAKGQVCWACGSVEARLEEVVETEGENGVIVESTEVWACEEHWDGEVEWDEWGVDSDDG